jgi:hypothetical protein
MMPSTTLARFRTVTVGKHLFYQTFEMAHEVPE